MKAGAVALLVVLLGACSLGPTTKTAPATYDFGAQQNHPVEPKIRASVLVQGVAPLDEGPEGEEGKAVFEEQGCGSCHALADAGVDAARDDPDLRELVAESEQRLAELEEELKLALVETDPADEKDVILEIRQGVGGDEAAIWAGDLFRMLTRYAESRGFKTELLSANESETGGFKEVVFAVKGDGAYSIFKYEGGTHRVQRVPETESQGRIHTSTATVAVMPEVEEIDVEGSKVPGQHE